MAHPRILSLFSGIGGLDEGVRLALPGASVLAYVEREAYAAACLLARMEEGSMGLAPIWCGEIERLDVAPFVGAVDLVTAGFPCPGNSVAGKRLGIADKRWLWPHVLRIAIAVHARWIFVENPRGLLSVNAGVAFGSVLWDLAGAGFDAEWAVLSAQEAGASHRRERIFLLAHAVADAGNGFVPQSWRRSEGRRGAGSTGEDVGHADDGAERARITQGAIVPGGAGEELAYPSGDGPREGRTESVREQGRHDTAERDGEVAYSESQRCGDSRDRIPCRRGEERPECGREELADADIPRPQERQSERSDAEQEFASALGSLPLFAPGPNDSRWADIPEFLWPATELGVRRLVAGVPILLDPARAHQIRCVGNSCGILQAACAFVGLVRRF